MAKRYDPIMCMMVEEKVNTKDGAYGTVLDYYNQMKGKSKSEVEKILASAEGNPNAYLAYKKWKANYAKAQDELSLAQKKQVVTELKGYLKKSYNFSDESEYARAYEDLRHMFTTGSRKSISGLFENTVKKTGSHDSVKAKDRDPYAYEEIKKDIQMMKSGKASYITKNELIGRISHSFNNRTPQSGGITKEQKTELMNLVMSAQDAKKVYDAASALDKAIKACDASTEHKVVVFVENYLRSIGKNNSTGKYDKIVQGVRSLLSQSLLDDDGLKKAAEHEADRLLKKYNL